MREFITRILGTLIDLQGKTCSPMASLERSIATARQAHISARRALAVATAEETRETERHMVLTAKANDLEKRAMEALRAGREDLATQAAEAIASMANEIHTSERASERFAAEVALARREVDAQRRRLSDLDRGRRLARIGDALTATTHTSRTGLDSFSEAEAALAKVVADNQDARFVRTELAPPAEWLVERMSDAGFGEPVHIRACDVLARLRSAADGLHVLQPIEFSSNPQQKSHHVSASDASRSA
jgi:phage shock protein A